MSNNDVMHLFQIGCADAKKAVAWSGSALNFMKRGQKAYASFIKEKTDGRTEVQAAVWLGGFTSTMLNQVMLDALALEHSVKIV